MTNAASTLHTVIAASSQPPQMPEQIAWQVQIWQAIPSALALLPAGLGRLLGRLQARDADLDAATAGGDQIGFRNAAHRLSVLFRRTPCQQLEHLCTGRSASP